MELKLSYRCQTESRNPIASTWLYQVQKHAFMKLSIHGNDLLINKKQEGCRYRKSKFEWRILLTCFYLKKI
jgi:hypothetical protein